MNISLELNEIKEQIKIQYKLGKKLYSIVLYDEKGNLYKIIVNINDYFTYDEIKEL